jgi:hypothetical protein
MCGIIMLIFGIVALAKGSFSLTRGRVVKGIPARMVGLLLVLPFPISFGAGLALGVYAVSTGMPEQQVHDIANVLGVVIAFGFLIAALVTAFVFATPVEPKRPRFAEEDEDDYGSRYEDRRGRPREMPPRDYEGKDPGSHRRPDDEWRE